MGTEGKTDLLGILNGREIVAKDEEHKLLVTWNGDGGSRLQLWRMRDGTQDWYEEADEAETMDGDRPTRVDAERCGAGLLVAYVEAQFDPPVNLSARVNLRGLFHRISEDYVGTVQCENEDDNFIHLVFFNERRVIHSQVIITDASIGETRLVRVRDSRSSLVSGALVSDITWAVIAVAMSAC